MNEALRRVSKLIHERDRIASILNMLERKSQVYFSSGKYTEHEEILLQGAIKDSIKIHFRILHDALEADILSLLKEKE